MAATIQEQATIRRTPGVVGGRARIRNSRIPVWLLVGYRQLGWTEDELLDSYPTLTPDDLGNAWAYYLEHTAEIDQDLADNDDD